VRGRLPAGGIEIFTLVVQIDSNTPNNTVITIEPTATNLFDPIPMPVG
jgi:hypothetical protein